MIRVKSGHYRDVFARVVSDVKRYSVPFGGKAEKGWEFTISQFKMNKMGFSTKEDCARQARVAIYDQIDAEANRQRVFDEANRRHPLPVSGAGTA